MKYQLERLENLAHSQQLLSELFVYIGEHQKTGYITERPEAFFRAWGGNDPMLKLKVFTARSAEGRLQGVIIVLLVENPLFLAKPFIHYLVDLSHQDTAFQEYVRVILEAL